MTLLFKTTVNLLGKEDICDRCKKSTKTFTMSMFNTDWICFDCQEKEMKHPDYEKARKLEAEQVELGNYNYEGIGLPNDLKR